MNSLRINADRAQLLHKPVAAAYYELANFFAPTFTLLYLN